MKLLENATETKQALKLRLERRINELMCEVLELEDTLMRKEDMFPFYLGQTVYDIALRNDKGRYTTVNPSREHCTITEVKVDEKNYFKLVKRYAKNDVFFSRDGAELYLDYVCNVPISDDYEEAE